jgi:selenide,water dikinase
VDYFTPVVDDPYAYGAIAAANAMSDVYAMGGQVILALNIAGFPGDMQEGTIVEIFRGGAEKVREAGGVICGGHTIDDKEPKYGLSVTGIVHPEKVATKGGARPGDELVLTKPLGVGVITTAIKRELAEPEQIETATKWMMQLNDVASRTMQEVGFHAATDITGFSLLGHGLEMARHSKVRFQFRLEDLPFHPGAKSLADQMVFPGGSGRNREAFAREVAFAPGIDEPSQLLLFTPETSGGLLVAVPPGKSADFLSTYQSQGQQAWSVGQVVEGTGIEVRVR